MLRRGGRLRAGKYKIKPHKYMDNQMTAAGALALFDTNKEERKKFRDQVLTQLKEGYTDPLKLHIWVKCIEELVKELQGNKDYKRIITDAAEKAGKNYALYNAEISTREVPKYDYSECNDWWLNQLYEEKKVLEQQIKDREQFLKGIPKEGIQVLGDGGEVVTVNPPHKTSITSVTLKLK